GRSQGNGSKPYARKDGRKNFVRKNDRIRATEVRVIDYNGEQLGVMQTSSAVALAKSKGLDLIEISPNTQPPVCKILDFGKYKYDEGKKNKQSTKTQSSKIKEVKLRVAIDQNDYDTKMRHSIEFLEKGFKLKISLMFRGRELAHSEMGFDLVKRFANDLCEHGVLDVEPKLFGKIISATMSPLSAQKKLAQVHKRVAQPTKILDASELLKLQ
ncbi:MAG: translation initiation factor IF-3, partial [Puniceicoccales bacterium]|nr:translation initiation factor IF-3 [Puniceicoccales bacterium]